MTRLTAVFLLALALLVTAGCLDSTGPRNPPGGLAGLIVSEPVGATSSAVGSISWLGSRLSLSGTLVYVSLVPGTVPTGLQATIRNQSNGQSVMTLVIGGGFDPVPIVAEVGDSLQVEITRSGAGPLVGSDLVKPLRPPTVVRTSPPKGGRDVPLNAVIVIVFSEPIDSATLTTESVQLWRAAIPVAGTVRFADAAHLRVEFHPDSLLAPQTAYRLVATQGIHDSNGDALDSSLDVPFATGTIRPATGLVFSSVGVGQGYACGLTTAGAAYCWGSNGHGELGNGTTTGAYTPVPVTGGLTFATLSVGFDNSCGVTAAGAAFCWGSNGLGNTGTDSATAGTCGVYAACVTPVPVAGGLTFAMVSVGVGHSCGVTTAGAAYCWGFDSWGQLGNGPRPWSNCIGRGHYVECHTPVVVDGGLTFASVSSGDSFSCGVTTTGAVYCWGGQGWGQLGDGSTDTTGETSTPVAVAGGLTFRTVSAGWGHACGLTVAGAAYCWGSNSSGELGTGTMKGPQQCPAGDGVIPCSSVPVPVTGGLTFESISAGGGSGQRACGVTTAGVAYCWGAYLPPSFVDAALPPSATPVAVTGGLAFMVLSASSPSGWAPLCGVTLGGAAYCWGDNSQGQLGTGTTTSSLVPVKVAGQP